MSKLDGTKKMIRAVLLSSKEGIAADKMFGDYKAVTGGKIPYEKLGFSSLHEFILSIPDVVRVARNRGELMYHAVADETTQHIKNMVSNQRSKKKKVTSYKGYKIHHRVNIGRMGSGIRSGHIIQHGSISRSMITNKFPQNSVRKKQGLLGDYPSSNHKFKNPFFFSHAVPRVHTNQLKPPMLSAPPGGNSYHQNNLQSNHNLHVISSLKVKPKKKKKIQAETPPRVVKLASSNSSSYRNPLLSDGSESGPDTIRVTVSHNNRAATSVKSGLPPRFQNISSKENKFSMIKEDSDMLKPISDVIKNRIITILHTHPEGIPASHLQSSYYQAHGSTLSERIILNLSQGNVKDVAVVEKISHGMLEKIMLYPVGSSSPRNVAKTQSVPVVNQINSKKSQWQSTNVEFTNDSLQEMQITNVVRCRIRSILSNNPKGVIPSELASAYYETYQSDLQECIIMAMECGLVKNVARVEKLISGHREKIIFHPLTEKISKPLSTEKSKAWTSEIVECSSNEEISEPLRERIKKLLFSSCHGLSSSEFVELYFETYKCKLPERILMGLECGLIKDVAKVRKLICGNREKILFYPLNEVSPYKSPKYSAIPKRKIVQLPQPEKLLPGIEYKVFISHIKNCDNFSARLSSSSENLKKILEVTRTVKFGGLDHVTAGIEVINNYEGGQRGRILSITDKEAEVYHIDSGETRRTNVDKLAPIPHEIQTIPELATRCSLFRNRNPEKGWSERATLQFRRLCLHKKCTIKVNSNTNSASFEDPTPPVYVVTCYLENFNINARLFHEELDCGDNANLKLKQEPKSPMEERYSPKNTKPLTSLPKNFNFHQTIKNEVKEPLINEIASKKFQTQKKSVEIVKDKMQKCDIDSLSGGDFQNSKRSVFEHLSSMNDKSKFKSSLYVQSSSTCLGSIDDSFVKTKKNSIAVHNIKIEKSSFLSEEEMSSFGQQNPNKSPLHLIPPIAIPWLSGEYGRMVDVIVTNVLSPGKIQMTPIEKLPLLAELVMKMTKFYNSQNHGPAEILVNGSFYAAPCSIDGATEWRRIKINKRICDVVSVYLVDFGTFDCISAKKVCILSPKFSTVPPFSMSAQLAGIRPKNNTEECLSQSTQMLESRLNKKRLTAHVLKVTKLVDQLTYDVCLYDQNEWINDVMVDKWKLAEYIEPIE